MRFMGSAALATAVTGGLVLGYAGIIERQRYTLREVDLVLPQLSAPLKVLHISDIHYALGQDRKRRWLRSLAQLQPDLVINTGDNLSDARAVPEVLAGLDPLLAFPGVYVPGSNDYFGPRWKNPLRYLRRPSAAPDREPDLPTAELFGAFDEVGWRNLSNTRSSLSIAGVDIDFAGVDDPHLAADEFPGFPEGPAGRLRIGVTHTPALRVLDQMSAERADLIFAGHTHGGQVCLPGGKALVTNCDLPTRFVKGLHYRSTAGASAYIPASAQHFSTVHVSAGIGTSVTAPVRLFCPPEATLLRLYPGAPDPGPG